jgi:two-component system response regulator WspF
VHSARVFEAMGHGALDVVEMPALCNGSTREDAAPLLDKLAMISRLVAEKNVARVVPLRGRRAPKSALRQPLVAIGASAGGPKALASVLHGLPKDFPAAIVIIQHVGAQFASGMAGWLSEQSAVPVAVAREGDSPEAGRVLLAGTSDHLVLKGADRVGYTPEPCDYAYRPSIDVFFESVSRLWPGDAVGVLLTGMGRDGALGLKALRNRGHHTIAQDELSSAVYGMPTAAAALYAAVDILPMERIASRLIDVVGGNG